MHAFQICKYFLDFSSHRILKKDSQSAKNSISDEMCSPKNTTELPELDAAVQISLH